MRDLFETAILANPIARMAVLFGAFALGLGIGVTAIGAARVALQLVGTIAP